MSIINQTLRDLDERKAASSPPQMPLFPVKADFSRKRGLQVAAVVVLITGMLVWFVRWPVNVIPSQPMAVNPPEVVPHIDVAVAVALPEPIAERGAMPIPADQPATQGVEHEPIQAVDSSRLIRGAAAESTTAGPQVAPVSLKLADRIGPPSDIRKEINKPSAEEDAEERYRKAVTLIQKGRENLARPLLEESLRLFPGHVAARQMLATLLSEIGLSVEAEAVLRDGRIASPDNTWFVLNLARLQAARGEIEGAVASLQSGIAGRGVNAEYRATLAALLARLKQHAEAAHQYGLALKLQPEQGTWWMGLGLAMAAQGKSVEAHAAYRRSLTAGNLPEKLEEFVRAKLAE
ncbi:MAG: tetratricopeptide repeat protein [Thiobacillus sp.]|nr:tetratricopeptide repeat protein [Thiobacillus sp.]